jgi:hypothetical protein
MRNNVQLKRQPTGCPVCGHTEHHRTKTGKWASYNPGIDVLTGVVATYTKCPASGLNDAGVDELFRTFESWDNPGSATGETYHEQLIVKDNADSIVLATELRLGRNLPTTTLEVRIAPKDVPRLLAELTAIAQERGLIA